MRLLILAVLTLFLYGCGAEAAETTVTETTTAPAETAVTVPETIAVEVEAEAMVEAPEPAVPVILQCSAPGVDVSVSGSAEVDYSNRADGYVMVRYGAETEKRLKVRVSRQTTYTYNLTPGVWTVFPLSDGDGTYRVTVYQNVSGSEYATVMSCSFDVALTDEFAPFLRPNQYVDYSSAPNAMALGTELCTGIAHPLEKVAAVYDYVVAELSYDYDKAATVKSGYLPVLDTVLAERKGICFDYAALMAGILRSQEVPCKLVVGYAGTTYHAWISVWTEENGWVDGVIFFDGHTWKRMDPTFASSQGSSDEIMDFIENGTYTVKYLY